MKCEGCRTNEAVIHIALGIDQTIVDDMSRAHYCAECAGRQGILWPGIQVPVRRQTDKLWQWKLHISGTAERFSKATISKPHSLSHQEGLAGDSVGKAIEDVRKASLVAAMKETVPELEAKLAKAVKEERYEDAAKIRDRIAAMQKPPAPPKKPPKCQPNAQPDRPKRPHKGNKNA